MIIEETKEKNLSGNKKIFLPETFFLIMILFFFFLNLSREYYDDEIHLSSQNPKTNLPKMVKKIKQRETFSEINFSESFSHCFEHPEFWIENHYLKIFFKKNDKPDKHIIILFSVKSNQFSLIFFLV